MNLFYRLMNGKLCMHLLSSRGVGEGNPVGILLERSLDTFIALLGVLKAGAAFVPLDPAFPSDRVAFIVEDAGLRDLVTISAFRDKTSVLSCPVLELDQADKALSLQHKITVLRCVSRQLASIESDVPSLRALLIGSEPCPADLVSRWARPGRRLLNTYGPTETTVTATWCELFADRPVTIGFPLPTYSVSILDDQLRLVKDGESGEIYIGGSGVAIGYFNRPDLTKERFIANPIQHEQEMVPRLYRTGDLGHITAAGEIEYLERSDTQEKKRSYRSELDEIGQILLTGSAMVKPFGTKAISELDAEASKLKMLQQMNLKNVYNHIMTDLLYRNSLFTMASTFILGGLGFVFWIIIARLYKTEDVGTATTLISIMILLSSFTIMGLNASLNRYLPKSANKNELINSSFVIVTLVTFLSSVIFMMGLQVFSPQLVFYDQTFSILAHPLFL